MINHAVSRPSSFWQDKWTTLQEFDFVRFWYIVNSMPTSPLRRSKRPEGLENTSPCISAVYFLENSRILVEQFFSSIAKFCEIWEN